MTPRPRKATDADVFAAAARVMARLGPNRLTLADIAAEAGLTAGALVQRFGAKRKLLLAIAARVPAATRETFADLRVAYPSPLAALHAYARRFAEMGASPGALAHHFAYLQLDLRDPEFHREALAAARAARTALRELLEAAVTAGELGPTIDAGATARAVQVVLSGSLTTWALYRTGTAVRWVEDDLEALLRALPRGAARETKSPRRRRVARRRH
jgi:AcrR family transcriptional regulator